MESKYEDNALKDDQKIQTISQLCQSGLDIEIKLKEPEQKYSTFHNYYGIFFALLASITFSLTNILPKKASYILFNYNQKKILIYFYKKRLIFLAEAISVCLGILYN